MSYTLLASRLSVVNGTDAFTAPIRMDGNAVQIDVVILANTATSLTCELQGSNDGVNFSVVTTNTGLTLGYSAPTKSTGVGFAWVRLRLSVAGTGTIILACGVNSSFQ